MSAKRDNRTAYNMITYLLAQGVHMLISVVLPRMLLATYGAETNGVMSTVNSFVSYFSYLEAGMGLTLIHALFKPLADNNPKAISRILTFSKDQYHRISYIYFFLVTGLAFLFPLFNKCESLETIELISLVFIIGVAGALDFYTMSRYRVLLTADRKEYVLSTVGIISQGIRFVLVWVLLHFQLSIVVIKLIPIVTLLVRTTALRLYIRKNYPQASYSEPYPKGVVETSTRWDAMIMQISISTSVSLPVILISQTQGYVEANVYAIYNLVAGTVISIVSSLSSGIAPLFGRILVTGGDIKKYYGIYEFVVSGILTVFFSVCAVMILPFVKLYTSVVEGVNYIRPTYALLVPLWAALHTFRMPLTAMINASALYKEIRINNILNLSIQVGGGIVMAIFFGVNGVVIAMILAAVQRNVGMSAVISRKVMNGNWLNSMKRQIAMVAVIVVSALIGFMIVPVEGITVFSWILYACAATGIIMVVSLCVLCVLDWRAAKNTLSYFLGKVKRKH